MYLPCRRFWTGATFGPSTSTFQRSGTSRRSRSGTAQIPRPSQTSKPRDFWDPGTPRDRRLRRFRYEMHRIVYLFIINKKVVIGYHNKSVNTVKYPVYYRKTFKPGKEMRFNLFTLLGKIYSWSFLNVLPGPAWVLLSKLSWTSIWATKANVVQLLPA